MFEDIHLEWQGKKYTIPADDVLKCIARVEDVVSVGEVAEMLTSGRLKFAKIAKAYATFLRYAGARVKDEEVFVSIFPSMNGGADILAMCLSRLELLMKLMSPPESLLSKLDSGKDAATTH